MAEGEKLRLIHLHSISFSLITTDAIQKKKNSFQIVLYVNPGTKNGSGVQ